jgi:hypothetical protein
MPAAQLTIQLQAEPTTGPCSLCGHESILSDGLTLCLEPGSAFVCRECGKKQAPSLVALLDLAQVASKAGRVARHTLVPSLETLLDLARAAENYTFAAECTRQIA